MINGQDTRNVSPTPVRRLSGKVALVTGAARGIGRAIAEAFVREGAEVVIVDVAPYAELESVAHALQREGGRARGLQADVADERAVEEMVDSALAEFGRLDILVNNAGITQQIAFLAMTSEDWDRVLNVDLRGVFLVTRSVVPSMLRVGSGNIINIASQLAQRGAPLLTHYCAAKAGVIGFTKSLARELAPTIRVNAIAPGPVLTDMVRGREQAWFDQIQRELPLGRLGLPEEVAASAVFLASDDAVLYTGQTLGPNCGHVMP